ncbi:MAG: hypothetical protein ACPGQL_02020 [Thermoplasmatota archaeon]
MVLSPASALGLHDPAAPIELGRDSEGDLRLTLRDDPLCPAGAQCITYRVTCDGAKKAAAGAVALRLPEGDLRGLVVFHAGAEGKRYWSDVADPAAAFIEDLVDRGYGTAELRWNAGWATARSGEQAGLAELSCRPATVLAWLDETVMADVVLPDRGKGCTFCYVGTSMGAAAGAYALTYHGLDHRMDLIVFAAGPPTADMAAGCMADEADLMGFHAGGRRLIDRSYGLGPDGPCSQADPGWADRWAYDSLTHPRFDEELEARVHFIVGKDEAPELEHQALLYRDHLRDAGTDARLHRPAGMQHILQESPEGLRALGRILAKG